MFLLKRVIHISGPRENSVFMASDKTSDPALTRALAKRQELQDTIRVSIKELEKVETFLRMYREWSTGSTKGGLEQMEGSGKGLGKAGAGLAQPLFETLVCDVLRERAEPLQSQEVLEEFHKRGHPLGGANEMKQMWNRLWHAKVNGVLVHFPKPGYWLADEPIPESASARKQAENDAERVSRGEPARKIGRRPPGKKKYLWDDNQIQAAKRMALEGKTAREICAGLGGISVASFYAQFPGGITAIINAAEPESD
jgi:hypothetical protein